MHALLLCSGPSLARFDPATPADLVCGVNRAAIAHRCDIWACGDWPLLCKIRGDVLKSRSGQWPILFTAANSHSHLRDHDPAGEWAGEWDTAAHVVEFESLYDGHESQLQWTIFTATAALWYLGTKRGCSRIDVHGADWAGRQDFDGVDTGGTRDDSRWKMESEIWENLTRVLGERGTKVRRL